MLGKIMDYEAGTLTMDEILELFADLIKTGMAWELQGSYGRTAHALIEGGVINLNGEIDYEKLEEEVY